jgi:murein DD-endopeptidase MepM/ murein hydrolase activator NlpD
MALSLLVFTAARPASGQAPTRLELDLPALVSRALDFIYGIPDLDRHGWPARHERLSRAGIRRPLHIGVLSDYLTLMHKTASYAQVTSDFYDPRPGRLHSGYDIGLDYGTRVPCGWTGRVIRITPWYGAENGITVESNGIEVTYGHLAPDVKVGQMVRRGETVGHIVWNHVDIKMRCWAGFIDWGKVDPFDDPGLTELHCESKAMVSFASLGRPAPRVSYASSMR